MQNLTADPTTPVPKKIVRLIFLLWSLLYEKRDHFLTPILIIIDWIKRKRIIEIGRAYKILKYSYFGFLG